MLTLSFPDIYNRICIINHYSLLFSGLAFAASDAKAFLMAVERCQAV